VHHVAQLANGEDRKLRRIVGTSVERSRDLRLDKFRAGRLRAVPDRPDIAPMRVGANSEKFSKDFCLPVRGVGRGGPSAIALFDNRLGRLNRVDLRNAARRGEDAPDFFVEPDLKDLAISGDDNGLRKAETPSGVMNLAEGLSHCGPETSYLAEEEHL
jgi:hypothetical protein